MTVVSVAEAARHLGIDPKTLRRWLAEAQLPLQAHPDDARKKGISRQHLELLARVHQRRLLPLSEERPTPVSSEPPTLAAALLALPDQLASIQAQLIAVQQHMAQLTQFLQQHAPSSASPVPVTRQPNARRQSSPRTPPVSRARPPTIAKAKPPHKPAHVIPRVEYASEGHYVVICPKRGVLSFEPDTPEWFAWVKKQDSFRFVGKAGHFTAHHEWRVPRGAWRAHRKIRNHNHIVRLAPNQELTLAVLEQAAAALQAHLTEQ